jgi:cysteine protease ATG4
MRKSLSKEIAGKSSEYDDNLNLYKGKSEGFTSSTNTSKRNYSHDRMKINNIKEELIITKDKAKQETKSIWSDFRTGLSNLKNNIKYNTLILNTVFELHTQDKIKLFDRIVNNYNDNNVLKHGLYYIIYMTYRNDFKGIQGKAKLYTTDCGWGCMLRSAQMMLANALYKIKEFEHKQQTNIFNDFIRRDIVRKTVALFLDSPIPYSDLLDNKDFDRVVEKLSDDVNVVKEDIQMITPPFSIQNICKFGELRDKEVGDWYSDVNMTGIFQQINTEFRPVGDFEIISFKEGVIYQNDIIASCFEETIEQPSKESNVLSYNDKNYKFKSKGIIFLSLRLGLDKLEPMYHNLIPKFFDIPNNIGIIGGKSYSAHYFIGVSNGRLMYLDPHINQKSISYKELRERYTTYLEKEVYLLEVKNMSPAFTVGFYFRSFYEYIELISAFKYAIHQEHMCFKFEEVKVENDGFVFVDAEGDDFDI